MKGTSFWGIVLGVAGAVTKRSMPPKKEALVRGRRSRAREQPWEAAASAIEQTGAVSESFPWGSVIRRVCELEAKEINRAAPGLFRLASAAAAVGGQVV